MIVSIYRAGGWFLLTACLLAWGETTFAQVQLPTLDEALDLSQKSGAPILAMAGRKT